jgi:Tol biopolymer transport system component
MTALTHDQVRQFLEMDREQLGGAERAALDQHLAECAACRSYATELAALQGAVERVLQSHWEGVRPDPQLENRIHTRIRIQTMPKNTLNNALGLAGLVMFTLIAIALFSTRTQSTATTSPVATTPVTPVESPFPASTPLNGQDFYQLQRLTTMSRGASSFSSGASQPAVSPDGRRVVYSGTRVGDDNSEIYVLDLASRAETRLTDDPSNRHIAPTWSPDGTHIAYERFPVEASFPDLVDHIVMNADGSNPQVMFSGAGWAGHAVPAWSPSGDKIAFMDDRDLVVFSVNDRREIRRLGPVEELYTSQPIWFDENRILFVNKGAVKLGNVASGMIESVAGPTGFVSHVMALGTDIAYVQKDESTARVIRQDLGGTYSKTMSVLQTGGWPVEAASWSPDGRFVAVQTMDGLYVATGHVPASWQHAPMFNLKAALYFPLPVRVSWLPDSSGFVVEYAFNVERDLYLVLLNLGTIKLVEDNAPAAQVPPLLAIPTLAPTPTATPWPFPYMYFNGLDFLTAPSGGAYLPAVSPDGQRVLYASVRDDNRDIYLLDLTTLAETRLTDDPRTDTAPTWSPDGRRIAYQRYASAVTGSGSVEWVVTNADGSNPQVVASGAQRPDNERPAWSPSGDRLAFMDGSEIVVVSVNDRRELRRFDLTEKPLHSQPVWFDNDQILFISQGVLRLGQVATGTSEPVTGPSGVVSQVIVQNSVITYIQQEGTTARVIQQNLDGTHAVTVTTFQIAQSGQVEDATLSPDGRYIAVQTDVGLYVVYLTTEQPATYLMDVQEISWLPASYSPGFVCVVGDDGQRLLYLDQAPPTSADEPYRPLKLPTPTPTPTQVGEPFLTQTPGPMLMLTLTPTP